MFHFLANCTIKAIPCPTIQVGRYSLLLPNIILNLNHHTFSSRFYSNLCLSGSSRLEGVQKPKNLEQQLQPTVQLSSSTLEMVWYQILPKISYILISQETCILSICQNPPETSVCTVHELFMDISIGLEQDQLSHCRYFLMGHHAGYCLCLTLVPVDIHYRISIYLSLWQDT